tara:strand:- start:7802 stop:9355 length:1554 start_codon:yes stop_codon:yes gene_type:complete
MFIDVLKENQLKLINLYDLDELSTTKYSGDRKYWGWKTIDFENDTMIGGCLSIAISVRLGVCLYDKFYLQLINGIFNSLSDKVISKSNGLEEAYPNENSFCVTSLVANDLLMTIYLLDGILESNKKIKYLEILEPLIDFIHNNIESHGIISNHLATAASAIEIWNVLSNKELPNPFIEKIIKYQSDEGWYLEYEGADPGYQTLTAHYLSMIHYVNPSVNLLNSVRKSFKYLIHFLGPNHSIGGLYGSRNTEIIYPGGINYFSKFSSEAAKIDKEISKGLKEKLLLQPHHIDIDNYIPLLNSFSWRAFLNFEYQSNLKDKFFNNFSFKQFDQSGIIIKRTKKYFAVINYKKGGAIRVFDIKKKTLIHENGGLIITFKGNQYTSQKFNRKIKFNNKSHEINFYKKQKNTIGKFSFIIVRILTFTLLRLKIFNDLFKKLVVSILITRKQKQKFCGLLRYEFKDEKIEINFKPNFKMKGVDLSFEKRFTNIHMASSKYFLPQHIDLYKSKNKIVKYLLDAT